MRMLSLPIAILAVLTAAPASAQEKSARDVLAALGDPGAFLSANQQRFKFELDAIEQRFISVFGGVCVEVARIEPPGDEGNKPPAPPPKRPPGPPNPPPEQPDGPPAQVSERSKAPAPVPQVRLPVIADAPPPAPFVPVTPAPDGPGKITGIDLLDATAERNISVSGFDPLNESHIRSEFQVAVNNAGNNDGGGAAVDPGNNDGGNNNAGGNNGGGNAGGFQPDQITVSPGAPPSQITVYLDPATGGLSLVETPGTIPLFVGFDSPTEAFFFVFGQARIVAPPVAASLVIAPGQNATIIIEDNGGNRFGIFFQANANGTITLRTLT